MHDCDCMNTRNRFNPENRFVGDIEDGKRYPFGVYTKEESDAKYAAKAVEEQVTALTAAVSSKAEEQECADIRARLDALEYKPIEINSFSVTPALSELGSSQTITLAWSLNKQATQQNINGTPVEGNTKQFIGVSSDQVYTLTATDGNTSASMSVRAIFANQIYYGVAADTSDLSGLFKVLSNDAEREITVNAGEGEYIIYALPVRLGAVKFYVSGFEGGFEEPVVRSVTNESGYYEQYQIYRSTNANLGETTVDIKEV